MDGVRVAWRGWLAAHSFLFWALVEWATRTIYWHKEASREQLILKPRRPKDLYDNGYALFAYDMTWDAWRGYWRTPGHQPGMAPEEMFEIPMAAFGTVPFHEVEFSAMPEISFKCRAVALDWCREHLKKPGEWKLPEVALPKAGETAEDVPTVAQAGHPGSVH